METKNIFLPLIIVGNKVDMEDSREISKEDAENFAKENNYKYFETSAKTGEGVDEAIRELVTLVLNQNGEIDQYSDFNFTSCYNDASDRNIAFVIRDKNSQIF